MENQGDWSDFKIGQSRRILIVDDETPVRMALTQYLEWDGYEVALAGSGGEALDLLQNQAVSDLGAPDIIVLDPSLSDMNGFALAHEIRNRSNVPIVVISSVTDTDIKVQALIEFAQDYVAKPFDEEELATRIWRILEISSQSGEPNSDMDSKKDVGCRWGGYLHASRVATSPDGHRRYSASLARVSF